jgi:hypothetical protein
MRCSMGRGDEAILGMSWATSCRSGSLVVADTVAEVAEVAEVSAPGGVQLEVGTRPAGICRGVPGLLGCLRLLCTLHYTTLHHLSLAASKSLAGGEDARDTPIVAPG